MSDMLYKMVLIVVGINVMLFIGQIAILNTNPSATQFYQCEGNALGKFEATGCGAGSNYTLNNTNGINELPSDVTKVSGDNTGTSNILTDIWSSIKNWFLQNTGLHYVTTLLSAPYSLLAAIGLPQELTFAIGTLWYAFSLMVIVGFLRGA